MNRHLAVFVVFVTGLINNVGLAQNDPPKLRDETPAKHDGIPNQDLIDTVKSIRNQLGGGIAEHLNVLGRDESAKKEAEQEFDRELSRLATQAARNPQISPSVFGPQNLQPGNQGPPHLLPTNTHRTGRLFSPRSAPKSTFRNVASVKYTGTGQTPTALLRDAARRLDGMAADLEAANLYEEADEIRDQARRFWLKARALPNNSN